MTWNELINAAYEDANVIEPGATPTSLMVTAGQTRLNQLISSLSTEKLSAYQQVMQAFATGSGTGLVAGTTAYTLGSGGTLPTTSSLRAMRVTSWRAYYSGVLHDGGPVLSMAEFSARAKQESGELTAIPRLVGADTAFPLVNIRVFPPPSATPGTLELAYFTPITQIADFTATPTLPDGWFMMLRLNLALILCTVYPRETGIPKGLAELAQNAKLALVTENDMGGPAPERAA